MQARRLLAPVDPAIKIVPGLSPFWMEKHRAPSAHPPSRCLPQFDQIKPGVVGQEPLHSRVTGSIAASFDAPTVSKVVRTNKVDTNHVFALCLSLRAPRAETTAWDSRKGWWCYNFN